MKPVAAGLAPGETVHADARALIAAGNVAAAPADVNPFVFAPPIAPELAARAAGATIDLDRIAAAYARLAATADAIVVEGAGGALVPLGRGTDMLDIPARLGLPVLLVVGIRLGCLNHALLSALAISARGLRFAGWVANRIDVEHARRRCERRGACRPTARTALRRFCVAHGRRAGIHGRPCGIARTRVRLARRRLTVHRGWVASVCRVLDPC